jgi:hypothetical protein
MVIVKSLHWNALEVVRIDHKSYLQQLATGGTPNKSFQMCFDFELQSLNMFLDPIDLVYPMHSMI